LYSYPISFQKIRNMLLLGSDFIPQFLSNDFTLDPTYGCVLGDVGDVEDSGSGGRSAPVIILAIGYLNSRFIALSTGDATQTRVCTAWPNRTPQHP